MERNDPITGVPDIIVLLLVFLVVVVIVIALLAAAGVAIALVFFIITTTVSTPCCCCCCCGGVPPSPLLVDYRPGSRRDGCDVDDGFGFGATRPRGVERPHHWAQRPADRLRNH